jgi:hypothetical protein
MSKPSSSTTTSITRLSGGQGIIHEEPLGQLSAPEDADYDVFISYCTKGSLATAVWLRQTLKRVTRRHNLGREFLVFLDRVHLSPGPLQSEIYRALSASRCLVVLLDLESVDSIWMDKEIRYWLNEGGGSPERLFLVKADSGVNLVWDEKDFAPQAVVPQSLRQVFTEEQSWIDLSSSRSEDEVVRLCSRLTGIDPEVYLREEVRYQRSRRQQLIIVTAIMSVLAVLAAGSGVLALRSRDQARRSEQEALAQADAAEALLYTQVSPAQAISRAVLASTRSSSTTVRSSMLAVSQGVRRIEHVFEYPEATTNHPPRGTIFTPDGREMIAFGDGRTPGTTHLARWDLTNGAGSEAITVPVPNFTSVTALSSTSVVGCSDGRLAWITFSGARPVVAWPTDAVRPSSTSTSCSTGGTSGGAVALLGAADHMSADGFYINTRGETVRVPGAESVANDPGSRVAVMAGTKGAFQVGPTTRATALTHRPTRVTFGNSKGEFLLRKSRSEWSIVRQTRGRPEVSQLRVPPTAVDVAPLLDLGMMTGQLGWIDASGKVGWTGNGQTAQLEDGQGESTWEPYRSRIVPLDDKDFVAVYRSTAYVLRPPTGQTIFGDAATDQQPRGPLKEWSVTLVRDSIGSAPNREADPVLSTCPGPLKSVLLHGHFSDKGALLVKADPQPQRIYGAARLLSNCSVEVRTDSLSIIKEELSGAQTVLLKPFTADSIAYSPDAARVAVTKAGQPILVLSTAEDDAIPNAWDFARGSPGAHGALAALGTREVIADSRDATSTDIVFAGDGQERRVKVNDLAAINTVRPDGLGAVISFPGSERREYIQADDRRARIAHCAGKLAFRPGAEYQQTVAAAEAQIPVGTSSSTDIPVNCTSGSTNDFAPVDLISYDVAANSGRIMTWEGDRLKITIWSRSDAAQPVTWTGPNSAIRHTGSQVSLSTDNQRLLVRNGQNVLLYTRKEAQWVPSGAITLSGRDIAATNLVDDGTLVMAMNTNGAFEIYDAMTGRFLAAQLKGESTGVVGFDSVRIEDNLLIYFRTSENLTDTDTITIPITVMGLRRQLCEIFRASICSKSK